MDRYIHIDRRRLRARVGVLGADAAADDGPERWLAWLFVFVIVVLFTKNNKPIRCCLIIEVAWCMFVSIVWLFVLGGSRGFWRRRPISESF